ncbi:CHAT domain-containing protein [Patescibacteria group bacterium]|nr:CHAT domain-containing protein [Patescibacteria group bacterium]
MENKRLYEAFVYSERAKILSSLPEFDIPPPSCEAEAIGSIIEIVNFLPDDNTAILTFYWGHQNAFGWIVKKGRQQIFNLKMPFVRGGFLGPWLGEHFAGKVNELLISYFRERFDTPEQSKSFICFLGRKSIKETFDWEVKSNEPDIDDVKRLNHHVGLANQIASATYLYQVLFKQAEPALYGIKKILVVPDACLHYIPFEALIEEDIKSDYSTYSQSTEFLIKKYVFSYLPSVYFLNNTNNKTQFRFRHNASLQFVGFGNPNFSDSLFSIFQAMRIGPLPETEKEIKAIANIFSKQNRLENIFPKSFLGNEATKQNFLVEAPSATHLHIATHGGAFFDDDPNLYSLLFSSYAETWTSFAEKALLKPDEIAKLQLCADLVVLSVCRSGMGKYQPGEGLLGFAQAFLKAGAKSVLVGLWNVEDEKSSIFMNDFYSALFSGESIAESCAFAKREMMKRDPDPFYWAPFIVYGGF